MNIIKICCYIVSVNWKWPEVVITCASCALCRGFAGQTNSRVCGGSAMDSPAPFAAAVSGEGEVKKGIWCVGGVMCECDMSLCDHK